MLSSNFGLNTFTKLCLTILIFITAIPSGLRLHSSLYVHYFLQVSAYIPQFESLAVVGIFSYPHPFQRFQCFPYQHGHIPYLLLPVSKLIFIFGRIKFLINRYRESNLKLSKAVPRSRQKILLDFKTQRNNILLSFGYYPLC